MGLTYRDIVEILQIVDASGFSQLAIEDGSFRLRISRGQDGHAMPNVVEESRVPMLAEAAPLAVVAGQASQLSNGEAAPVAFRRVNVGGLELSMSQSMDPVEVPQTAAAVLSPMLGVFYRQPSPEAPPYVDVGSRVSQGDTLCLVESMKMFMPVQSPVDGTVVAIPVENKALVEFNQPLIWVDPEVQ